MRIGILETGRPPRELEARYGRFDAMFRDLIGPDHEYRTYRVQQGEWPRGPTSHDAYVVTGSSAGVYEAHDWIPPLLDLLREAKGRAKLVGVCFGHQAMAEAFGGKVVKSEKGTGLGLHDYAIALPKPWMDDDAPLRIAASHGDQVVALPPEAEVIAGNDFAPYAALAYRDQPAISFQFHPEFEADFARALTEWQRAKVSDETFAASMASFERPDNRRRIGAWIRAFLAA